MVRMRVGLVLGFGSFFCLSEEARRKILALGPLKRPWNLSLGFRNHRISRFLLKRDSRDGGDDFAGVCGAGGWAGNRQIWPVDLGTGRWSNLLLAYKTLGVVFGGLVTSPLYVYPSMHLNSPTEEDYLGIYSIMFWTLTLIGVVKYACIALKADDQGEGGTFALYSLLHRNMNIGILSSKHSDLNSSQSQPVLHEDTKGKSRLGKLFERSIVARRVLAFIAMLGTCMLIGDGILTPAISVLSAMDGLRAPFPSVTKS